MSKIKAMQNRMILDAAIEANKGEETKLVIAERIGITVETLTDACIVLLYGTPEEVQTVEGGVGISTIAKLVRPRMTPEQRQVLRYKKSKAAAAFSDERRDSLANGANLWAKFRPVLTGLDELPAAKDMIKIITGHRKRVRLVGQHLNSAFKWMEEFTNEWNQYQLSKSAKGAVDAGNGDTASGVQHAKPASE